MKTLTQSPQQILRDELRYMQIPVIEVAKKLKMPYSTVCHRLCGYLPCSGKFLVDVKGVIEEVKQERLSFASDR